MATTDAKPGFRLPWSSDRSETDEPGRRCPGSAPPAKPSPTAAGDRDARHDRRRARRYRPRGRRRRPVASAPTTPRTAAAATSAAPTAARKPNKFMADLTKAMQAAAETARERHPRPVQRRGQGPHRGDPRRVRDEATDLRKQADDDVAGIRDWSKAEIARIREETDERITHRKAGLEREIEEHAA